MGAGQCNPATCLEEGQVSLVTTSFCRDHSTSLGSDRGSGCLGTLTSKCLSKFSLCVCLCIFYLVALKVKLTVCLIAFLLLLSKHDPKITLNLQSQGQWTGRALLDTFIHFSQVHSGQGLNCTGHGDTGDVN
jgi:hypothetical protein